MLDKEMYLRIKIIQICRYYDGANRDIKNIDELKEELLLLTTYFYNLTSICAATPTP